MLFLCVQDQGGDQTNWNRYLCLYGPKTSRSCLISLKTSRQIPQTESWSSLPLQLHVGTQTPELETSALAPCDICLRDQGQPLHLWSSCFLNATIHQVFKNTKNSGTAIAVVEPSPGLISKYNTGPVLMVQFWCLWANMRRRWRWSWVSLGH